MRRWFFFLVLVGLVAPWTALAQDSFKDVEYVAGKEGWEKKVTGWAVQTTTVMEDSPCLQHPGRDSRCL